MDLLNSVGETLGNFFTWSSSRAAVSVVFAGLCTVFSLVFDLAHPSMVFLLWLVLIDSVLGAIVACQEHRFSLRVFVRLGVSKLTAYALIFIVTHVADNGLNLDGWVLNITVALSCYAISGESGSSLRHIDTLFPGYVPMWAITRLARFHDGFQRQFDKAGDATPGESEGAAESNGVEETPKEKP